MSVSRVPLARRNVTERSFIPRTGTGQRLAVPGRVSLACRKLNEVVQTNLCPRRISAFIPARFTAGGVVDTRFNPGTGTNDTVLSHALPERSFLLGGEFTQVNKTTCNRLAQLAAAGQLDVTSIRAQAWMGRGMCWQCRVATTGFSWAANSPVRCDPRATTEP